MPRKPFIQDPSKIPKRTEIKFDFVDEINPNIDVCKVSGPKTNLKFSKYRVRKENDFRLSNGFELNYRTQPV